MALLVTDPDLETRLKAERRRSDSDGHDEVWEGLYVMAPLPNDDHQDIQGSLIAMLREALGWDSAAKIRPGVNVSDRHEDWELNYRGPDVVVYLPGNPARNYGSHWQGGPDFLVEILSRGDPSHEKLPFYGKVGVREALYINRQPWALELYRSGEAGQPLRLVSKADVNGPALDSNVLPLAFKLVPGSPRPQIEVTSTAATAALPGARNQWLI
jgi:Uma2 family endonuclease